jgi:hypothetical protein
VGSHTQPLLQTTFAQRKAYGNDRAANSGFKSATTMFHVPFDRTSTISKSNGDCTTRDLYIESLEESLALAHDCVTNAPTLAPALTPIVDPLATLRLELDAQHKQFELLLSRIWILSPHSCRRMHVPTPAVEPPPNQCTLVTNICGHTSRSAPTARRCAPTSPMIVTPWQQMQTIAPLTIGHPRQPDRSRGPTLILI